MRCKIGYNADIMLKIGYNAVENCVYSAKSLIGLIFSSPKSHAITDLYCILKPLKRFISFRLQCRLIFLFLYFGKLIYLSLSLESPIKQLFQV